ncbi:helix-turn-helix transcriptional regulator [Variovorax sp. WS11]|uniref:helix-turn-helix domain-containing protein n=1 Tax=Variovorax sp. WS11 TaxID=1105204 RepID=UPI0031BA1207
MVGPRAGKTPGRSLRLVFATNVRMARIQLGLSQDRLALESGLDRTFISSLEQGIRNISVDNIEVLAKALHIPAHELMSPHLAKERGFDPTVLRVPRTAVTRAAVRRTRR